MAENAKCKMQNEQCKPAVVGILHFAFNILRFAIHSYYITRRRAERYGNCRRFARPGDLRNLATAGV
jgi:hypothetical protein